MMDFPYKSCLKPEVPWFLILTDRVQELYVELATLRWGSGWEYKLSAFLDEALEVLAAIR